MIRRKGKEGYSVFRAVGLRHRRLSLAIPSVLGFFVLSLWVAAQFQYLQLRLAAGKGEMSSTVGIGTWSSHVGLWLAIHDNLEPGFDFSHLVADGPVDAFKLKSSHHKFSIGAAHFYILGPIPPSSSSSTVYCLDLRYWCLFLLTISPLLVHFVRTLIAWKRQRSGRCRSCGYDLRTCTSRCPECGECIPAS